ncbi:MAG: NosR/NirI family protein [Hoeflea sp.]|nr:NosR/NirI family protein [Hoeflea sp.]MBV1761296.1 NosR/NirI family protein [Hoeflea sp.]MBV1785821.1 NosR/NirI family protein [Hoeflea sp.]
MAKPNGIRNWAAAACGMIASLLLGVVAAQADPLVMKFLDMAAVGEIVPGATEYGQLRPDIPVVEALKDGKVVGYVFLTSDFVTTTGYSGKPIHTLMGVDEAAKVTGVRLVKHSEPIVLIGIPEAKITAVTEKYAGLDLIAEAAAGGSAHDLDIVSGATVTIIVIDDSIVRAGLKVARSLGLGGLKPELASAGPTKRLVMPGDDEVATSDWQTLAGDGSVRSLLLDIGQVNTAFEETGDARAIKRPEKGAPEDTFIDMHMALVSAPEIGRTLLGDADYAQLQAWLNEGDQAILVLGRGKYSFKGSGYVRGGIFDRIQLIQGDTAVRFNDKQHRRLGKLATDDAPSFSELDIFRVPADSGFDPAEPFRLQLLVQRAVGAIDKTFLTFDLGYRIPDRYTEKLAIDTAVASNPEIRSEVAVSDTSELSHLWKRIWLQKRFEVVVLMAALILLTGVFFFQMQVTRHERFTYWFRIGFLTFTLVGLGWYANGQLSVVNILAFFSAVTTDFSWSSFLMDPLIFILWFSVAASLLFWGRGVYCGWLCPFGALQELTNQIARFFKVPQYTLPWGLHERLWPIKYMVFLGLFGLSLYSLEMAERYAEIEPFKTAIILKFQRGWPYILFVVVLLGAGLFIERFYCRYLCPLGAALAIPARMRMFDWLKRYKECGDPCQRCAKECPVQAIHPEGNINPNECVQCLHCQVLYQSATKCPVCIKKETKRAKFRIRNGLEPIPPSGGTGQPLPQVSSPSQPAN